MMYHFMLGLRGGSTGLAPSPLGEGTFSPSFAPASLFSSSCIDLSALAGSNTALPSWTSAMREIAEHRVNPMPDHKVHHPEIRREQENGDDHHRRSGPYFL